MVRVKICGITSENDIIHLNKYLPDYAGFVFARSRRQVSLETARSLAGKLDGSIRKVGVFVNISVEDLLEAAGTTGLDVVQLHGDEKQDYIEKLRYGLKPGTEVWKAVRVKDESSILQLCEYSADRYLTDAYADGVYGGAGRQFDWRLAEAANKYGSIILAGGLDPGNIQKAVETVRPYAVDVSSGVETDGCKDESKIREFINKARGLEA